MKYFIIILLLSGCSAEYHLKKALDKDSDILEVKADTVTRIEVKEADTAFIRETETVFKLRTDTVKIVKTITKKISFDTIKATNGIANAVTWIDAGDVNLQTWAVMDTVIKLQDTIRFKQEIITKYRDIIETKQAKIQKYSKFEEYVRWAAWILGLLILAGIVIFAIRLT